MATVTMKKRKAIREFGPDSNGTLMTPMEFDQADFVDGWRYELIRELLIVSPIPLENEADPNEELGRWLRNYQEDHPQGSSLNKTLPERTVSTFRNRRRADRLIWAGLGRRPRKNETPTIIVEFVSAGKRDRERDYEGKLVEYMEIGVREYWINDRIQRTMTVYVRGAVIKRVVLEKQIYATPLLPGFKLPLARLLALADSWSEGETQVDY